MKILAIDFETADYGADSACALGMVSIEDGVVAWRGSYLIRPPRRRFVFTYIHGLEWNDVKNAPAFSDLIPEISKRILESNFIAAHNAAFDRKVLLSCYARAGVQPPCFNTICTVRLAKKELGFARAPLTTVCGELGIELNHHEALSDANACAQIIIHATAQGANLENAKLGKPTYRVDC